MADVKICWVVKAIVVNVWGRCLLLRRSEKNKRFVGQWEWPGGKMETRENPSTSLHRELREETGFEADITSYVGTASFETEDTGVRYVVICMEVALTEGTLAISHDHDAAEWVGFSEFSKYPLVEKVRGFMLHYAAKRQSF